jgi:hypothetical protein
MKDKTDKTNYIGRIKIAIWVVDEADHFNAVNIFRSTHLRATQEKVHQARSAFIWQPSLQQP